MGLPQFPSAPDGVLPMLLMNTVLSVSLLRNLVRNAVQAMRVGSGETQDVSSSFEEDTVDGRGRNVCVTLFKRLSQKLSESGNGDGVKCCCCVCLCGFKDEEEVAELSCKHYFHRVCLDKWFCNYKRSTCPICRSVL